ncbi:MAG: XisH family protein [Caldilineaceae bacterium]
MAARDLIHNAVRTALENDGWTITDDPLTLEYKDVQVFIDLGAERVLAAEREGKRIAVEIKSFISRSAVHDLENALGQYVVYRSMLRRLEPDRQLYIAISHIAYKSIFQREGIRALVEDNHASLLVVDIENKKVLQWMQN